MPGFLATPWFVRGRLLRRSREIAAILTRHGLGWLVGQVGLGDLVPFERGWFGHLVRETPYTQAEHLRLALGELGATFIKLGQALSTRPDLAPPEYVAQLVKLQDEAPPVPFEQICQIVCDELGQPPETIFGEFDPQPLASASIGQAHAGKLKNGQQVIVKVQRPGVAEQVEQDLAILAGIAEWAEAHTAFGRDYNLVALVDEFAYTLRNELDYRREGQNADRFRRNFAGDPGAYIPRVYWEFTTGCVLTIERVGGIKIAEMSALDEAGIDRHGVAENAVRLIMREVFEFGFFHADPHPGNVMVLGHDDDPILVMIDLGMVGRLSPRMRDLTVDVMVGAVRRDYEAIADAMYAIGTPTKKIDMNAYRAEVGMLSEKYLGKQLKDIELSAMIRDLVQGATKYGLEIPSDFMLVGKALMTVEGVGKEIDPELDVFEEAKPLFVEILRKRYSPERLGNELLRRLEKLSGATYNMPQQLQEVLDDLRLGRLKIHTLDPGTGKAADRLGRRLFAALIGSALVLGGAWLAASGREIVGYVLIALAALLLGGHMLLDAGRAFRLKK